MSKLEDILKKVLKNQTEIKREIGVLRNWLDIMKKQVDLTNEKTDILFLSTVSGEWYITADLCKQNFDRMQQELLALNKEDPEFLEKRKEIMKAIALNDQEGRKYTLLGQGAAMILEGHLVKISREMSKKFPNLGRIPDMKPVAKPPTPTVENPPERGSNMDEAKD